MKKFTQYILTGSLAMLILGISYAKIPSIQGGEGFEAIELGEREGQLIAITNLNDFNSGALSMASIGSATTSLNNDTLSCSYCDHCTDSGRKIVSLYGVTTSRISTSKVYDKTYNLYNWYSDAVTGPGYGKSVALYGSDICTLGGTTYGHIDPSLTWRQVHDDVGGYAYQINVDRGMAAVIDARVHNVEDGFKPRETPYYGNLGTMYMRGAYMTNIRDDCIENDGFMSGYIEDCLLDGVFCFFSEQEQSGLPEPYVAISAAEDTNVYISNVYVRTDMTNAPDAVEQYTAGRWFKQFPGGGAVNHKIIIANSAFAISVVPKKKNGTNNWNNAGFPASTEFIGENYVLWLGPGEFGGTLPEGVIFLEGVEAENKWEDLRRNWLIGHGYLPSQLTATADTNLVKLVWSSASKVVSYNVLRSTTSGGAYTTIASKITDTVFVDTTGINGTKYYYKIAAVDYCDVAPTTTEVNATPEGNPLRVFESVENTVLIIYPNPTVTEFNIIISSEIDIKNTRMKIYDVSGKEVANILIKNHKTIVERGELQNGIYLYRLIRNNTEIAKGKIIVGI